MARSVILGSDFLPKGSILSMAAMVASVSVPSIKVRVTTVVSNAIHSSGRCHISEKLGKWKPLRKSIFRDMNQIGVGKVQHPTGYPAQGNGQKRSRNVPRPPVVLDHVAVEPEEEGQCNTSDGEDSQDSSP